MPLEMQATMLRVLQERVVERIGSDKPMRVDFRLCSATNHDLEELVEAGKFRLDLFYRISPVRILLPTLEERIEDVPLLLHHFIQELSEKYDRPAPEVDIDVPDFLMDRAWPGNVRQLRHEVERALIFAENGRLRISDFPPRADGETRRPNGMRRHATGSTSQPFFTIRDATEALEQRLIHDMMIRFKGNKKRVAEQLGISRSYLYKRLEDFGMDATDSPATLTR
jgi:DNA-binding NtrC family response regulator